MIIEFIKLIFCSIAIVLTSKYLLANNLRKLSNNIKLTPKMIGNISGIATSIPEFLTSIVSGLNGLIQTSITNILSSNIINTILFSMSIFINKNQKYLKNKVIIIELILVFITILIPIIIIKLNISIYYVFIFIVSYILFKVIDNFTHKVFRERRNDDKEFKKDIVDKGEIQNKTYMKNNFKYILFIILSGILLFFIGNIFSGALNNLARVFNVSERLIGEILGVITSMPEFITFFEAQKAYKNKEQGVIEASNNLLSSNMINLFIIQSIGILFLVK